MATPIKRKLKTPKDPVMKSTSATVKKKKAAAPAKAKAVKAKAAPAKAKATKAKAKTATDAKFDKDRAKHLRDTKKGAKGKTIEARLKARLAKYKDGIKTAKKSAGATRKLLIARQVIARKNLIARQKVAKENLIMRQAARLKAREARKPMIKKGKIVTPKVKAPKIKLKPKPKAIPLPRMKDGKMVTTKKKKAVATPSAKKGAKKAAKTKAGNKAVEA